MKIIYKFLFIIIIVSACSKPKSIDLNCNSNTWKTNETEFTSIDSNSSGFLKQTINSIDYFNCDEEYNAGNHIEIKVKKLPTTSGSSITYLTSDINDIKIEYHNNNYELFGNTTPNIDNKLTISFTNNEYLIDLKSINVFNSGGIIPLEICKLKIKKSF